MHKNIMTLLMISGLIIYVYFPVFNNFFQHDEWTGFATYLTDKNILSNFISYFIRPNVAHYTPLQGIIFYLMFKSFALNFVNYAAVSVILQVVTVYLVYILISKLFDNKLIGLISSGIFAVNASSYQATAWVGTTVNTHGASIFGLLSIIVYLKYLQTFKLKSKFLFICSILFIFISLLFKEITIAIFLILILIIFLFTKKISIGQKITESFKLMLSGFIYIMFRASMVFAGRGDVQESIVTESQTVFDMVKNFVTFPSKIFSQGLIPTQQLIKISNTLSFVLPDSITGLLGTTAFDIFSQQIMLQIINWTFFISAILLINKMYLAKSKYFRFALFGFLFSVLNSFIYVISPGRSGDIPVVDSRNIYLPAIGVTIFLISVTLYLVQKYSKKFYIILAVSFLINMFWLDKELQFYADQGSERKIILEQIKNSYPDLPEKVIFYTESDSSYYGMPETEKIFPFELNFGYTLMVWYLPTEKYSNDMVKLGGFLYKITDQGYQGSDKKGFGYFRDLKMLKQTLKDEKLPIESVLSFRYLSKTQKLEDITDEIRSKLKNDKI